MGKILHIIRGNETLYGVTCLSFGVEKQFLANNVDEIVEKVVYYSNGTETIESVRLDLELNYHSFLPMDKNGRFIWAGQQVRKTGTMADYMNPVKYLVTRKETLYIGDNPIEDYHTVNNYHTLEIT